MAGTTSEIARLLRDSTRTLAECATSLGLSRAQLDERIRMMERQGYLARVAEPGNDPTCTCGHCCATCSRKDAGALPVVYSLTAKGERLLVPGPWPE